MSHSVYSVACQVFDGGPQRESVAPCSTHDSTFVDSCPCGAPSLASFVAGEHHHRSRHSSCFCFHGRLASGNNGARQGDQWVRGDLPVLPHHSLAADVASLRPEPAILLRPLFWWSRERRRTSD